MRQARRKVANAASGSMINSAPSPTASCTTRKPHSRSHCRRITALLQTIAALDDREFPDGHNDAAAYAGEVWCRWFETLLTDAEAKMTLESKDPPVGTVDRPITSEAI